MVIDVGGYSRVVCAEENSLPLDEREELSQGKEDSFELEAVDVPETLRVWPWACRCEMGYVGAPPRVRSVCEKFLLRRRGDYGDSM